MLKTLEQHWSKISILLILVILASLFFWPGITNPLGMVGMFFALAMTVVFLVRGRVQAYRQQEQPDRAALMRNIALDLLGMLVALAIVSLVVKTVIQLVAGVAGPAVEQSWPGWGIAAAILSGLLAGVVVGALVGFVVKFAWGKLTKSAH